MQCPDRPIASYAEVRDHDMGVQLRIAFAARVMCKKSRSQIRLLMDKPAFAAPGNRFRLQEIMSGFSCGYMRLPDILRMIRRGKGPGQRHGLGSRESYVPTNSSA